MFGIFKKKTAVEKLQDRYKKLMSEWHELCLLYTSDAADE